MWVLWYTEGNFTRVLFGAFRNAKIVVMWVREGSVEGVTDIRTVSQSVRRTLRIIYRIIVNLTFLWSEYESKSLE